MTKIYEFRQSVLNNVVKYENSDPLVFLTPWNGAKDNAPPL